MRRCHRAWWWPRRQVMRWWSRWWRPRRQIMRRWCGWRWSRRQVMRRRGRARWRPRRQVMRRRGRAWWWPRWQVMRRRCRARWCPRWRSARARPRCLMAEHVVLGRIGVACDNMRLLCLRLLRRLLCLCCRTATAVHVVVKLSPREMAFNGFIVQPHLSQHLPHSLGRVLLGTASGGVVPI